MADQKSRRKNNVTIEGKIIRSEIKQTSKGDILLATLMFGGSKEKGSNFINLSIWKPGVDEVNLIENVVKDKSVVVLEGYLRQNKWQDREGNQRSTIDLGVNNVQLSENQPPKQYDSGAQERRTAAPQPPQNEVVQDNDIPF